MSNCVKVIITVMVAFVMLAPIGANAEDLHIAATDYLTYSDKTPVYGSLINGKTVQTLVTVSNLDNDVKTAVLVLALYSPDKLMTISVSEKFNISKGNNQTISASLALPPSGDISDGLIRLFILESIEDLKPLSPSEYYSNKDIKITKISEVGIKYITGQEYLGGFYVEPMNEAGFPYKYNAW